MKNYFIFFGEIIIKGKIHYIYTDAATKVFYEKEESSLFPAESDVLKKMCEALNDPNNVITDVVLCDELAPDLYHKYECLLINIDLEYSHFVHILGFGNTKAEAISDAESKKDLLFSQYHELLINNHI